MPAHRWRAKDIIAGILVAGIGCFALVEAQSYSMGTASRMGPGYFPFSLGLLMVLLGIGIAFVDARRAEADTGGENVVAGLRTLLFLPASVVVFALVVERFGLGPATFLALLVSTFADRTLTVFKSIAVSFAIALLCILIFRVGLGIQTRAFIW